MLHPFTWYPGRNAPYYSQLDYSRRPAGSKTALHRIEVEHALYLANAKKEEINSTLVANFQVQAEHLENVASAISELSENITDGFSAVASGLGEIGEGVYQLHLDTLGTHARLDDILFCLTDREGFQRELASRKSRQEAESARYRAAGEYADAINLTKRALNEHDGGKAGAMLDEAIALFERAARNDNYALQASFQLGYLSQMHQKHPERAYYWFERALGPDFSEHYVRTTRHLAHLDYLAGRTEKAFEWMDKVVRHDHAIQSFGTDLRAVNSQPWPDCIGGLETTLARHGSLLSRSSRMAVIQDQFRDQRRFTATEKFKDGFADIVKELRAIQPDLQAYFDAARYAALLRKEDTSVELLQNVLERQRGLSAKKAFLLTAMTHEDLRHE